MKTLRILALIILVGLITKPVKAVPQQAKEEQKKAQKEADKKAKKEEQKAKRAAKSFRNERTYY